VNPRDLVPVSVMPQYAFLLGAPLETASLPKRLAALRDVGVPYTDDMIANARNDTLGQALPDSTAAASLVERYGEATTVRSFDGRADALTEMDAVVAYLQVLGRLTDLPERAETLPEE
jgi:cytochrome c oxidase cbb3-type subunit 2